MRTGLIAKKLGMTSLYNENGITIPVTVLEITECNVTQVREADEEGYSFVQIAADNAKLNRTTKPMKGHFAKANVAPKRKIAQFTVASNAAPTLGSEITAAHFVPGQYIDVQGFTKGRGFSGVMKRWNFGGLFATHGVSVSHRSHGSTGMCQDPGKVQKGKKMAGHYGNEKVTIQNLEVVSVDAEKKLVIVKGAVPGSKGAYVILRDALKKAVPAEAPFPSA